MQHEGSDKCAWASELQGSLFGRGAGGSARSPPPYLCFIWFVPVWDRYYLRWFCIDLADLFPPCECSDGRECVYEGGEATCAYVCGDDEVGGGEEPCTSCAEGEVPNGGGTACEACEHGESSTAGTCNPDPCDGVYCPSNAHCDGGQCQCDAGYKPTQRLTGSPGEPEAVLECVPDPS